MSLYFTEEHQWIRLNDDGKTATVGISQHAQEALGDVVFVDLPEIGKTVGQFDVGAVVESVKTAADVLMPLSGTVTEVNEVLRADPALANADPMGEGWFYRVELAPSASGEITKLIAESAYNP